jgi:hypothetical protein
VRVLGSFDSRRIRKRQLLSLRLQKIDDGSNIVLLIFAQTVSPFFKFVGVLDGPFHEMIYSFYGILARIIP